MAEKMKSATVSKGTASKSNGRIIGVESYINDKGKIVDVPIEKVGPSYINKDGKLVDVPWDEPDDAEWIVGEEPTQNNAPVSRGTQLKRILATAGKGVVGNIALGAIIFAGAMAWWILPLMAMDGASLRDSLVVSGAVTGSLAGLWHVLGIILCRHPLGGFMMGADFFDHMCEKLPEKYNDAKIIGRGILDDIKQKMMRQKVK